MTEQQAEPSAFARWRAGYRRFVEPRPDGLPNRRVLGFPLALLAVLFVVLVALGVTGTSTGVMHNLVSRSADAALLAGEPEPIRSDEWFVQTTWTISQVQQGLPPRNDTFPGGMDATVQHDLPTTDWSTALRPHLWGFLFLPLDQAMAVKWWLPGFAMIAAAFLFAMVLLPRRPLTSLALAVGFFFAPFFQWWFLSITFYPPAWAFLVMATIVWCVRSSSRRGSWILAGLTAYLTTAMGTGIYVPFIVPAAWVAIAFGVGFVLMPTALRPGFRARFRAIVPVLVAGGVGVGVLGVWALTRWSTIVGFTSTVYPGQRLQPTGGAGWSEIAALLSGPFSSMNRLTAGVPWGGNSSEASTYLLPGLFLVVPLIWLVWSRRRRAGIVDWLLICLLGLALVFAAFLFVPGWDILAHVMFLDRTTFGRMRLGFGLLSFVMVVVVTARLSEDQATGLRIPRWPAIGALLLAIGSIGFAALIGASGAFSFRDFAKAQPLLAATVLLCILGFLLAVLLFAVGRAAPGAAVLLVVSVLAAGQVNPLYRGVLDLRETNAAQEIERIEKGSSGEWVGIANTPLPTMMLIESGVPSYNGFQSAPSQKMWREIDPSGRSERKWNRLANVSWVAGKGDPAPRNPAPDQIQLTFDSCAPFAQHNVTYVLSETDVDQSCLALIGQTTDGPTTMRFYKVVPQG